MKYQWLNKETGSEQEVILHVVISQKYLAEISYKLLLCRYLVLKNIIFGWTIVSIFLGELSL